MLPFAIPDQQSPFTLTAMTLRGIGSYLRGRRLDIKPLTVLCGKNGSGKSTWLKTLNLLKESLEAKRLPYGFSRTDSADDGVEFTNAFYFFEPPEAHKALRSAEEATDFGPPGTIGLELITNLRCTLPLGPPANCPPLFELPKCTNEAHEFLWKGLCSEGTRFRLRVAHPGYEVDSADTRELVDLIELQLNDKHVLRLAGPREPSQEFTPGQIGPRRSFPYTLSCSPEFLPTTHQHLAQLVKVGELTDINRRRWTGLLDGIDGNYATTMLDYLEARFRQILKLTLEGVFHVGAIRRTYDSPSLEAISADDSKEIASRRYVGVGGEYAWRLENAFGGNRMRSLEIKEIQPVDVEIKYDQIVDILGWADLRVKRIRDVASNALWERIMQACDSLDSILEAMRQKHILQCDGLSHDEEGALHAEYSKAYEAATTAHRKQLVSLLAAYLNSVLDSRDLFDSEAWEHHFGGARDIGSGNPPDPEIKYLADKGTANLDARSLRRLNSLLVRDTLTLGEDFGFENRLAETNDTYPFVSYLSRWLDRLVEVGLKIPNEQGQTTDLLGNFGAHHWSGVVSDVPTGLLLAPQHPLTFVVEPDDKLSRLIHPCFGRGGAQSPRQLSAGFHQIYPILVQLGVMKAGELLAIENPEVHLHPGLQLKLTEALIKHIPSGRRLIIETHSDLVVRRVLRAILQEEDGLGQSQVGIYFADLKREAHGYHNSTLEPLQINDQGQISNWPEGFMDDDVKESRRLMDAMYGREREEDEASDP